MKQLSVKEISEIQNTFNEIYRQFTSSEAEDSVFTRDVFRKLCKELGYSYKLEKDICDIHGSWRNAVRSVNPAEYKEEEVVYTSYRGAEEESDYFQTIEKTVPKSSEYKVLVIPDIHVPFHNKRALDCVIKAIKIYKPDEIVQIGDFMDCYDISKYSRNTYRKSKLKTEVDITISIMKDIKKAAGDIPCTMLTGNHEARIRKYLLNSAQALSDFDFFSIENLLKMNETGWTNIPEHIFYKINEQYFSHGEFASVNALNKNIQEYHVNIVTGHTHRMGSRYLRSLDKTVSVHEIGCIASFDVATDYTKRPNWQHGFATIVIKGDRSWVNLHHIIDGECSFMGHLIKGELK